MGICDHCGLYVPAEKRCKIGKPVRQLFCSTQDFLVVEDKREETLEQILQEIAQTDFGLGENP